MCKIGKEDIFNPEFDISKLSLEEIKKALEIVRLMADELRHHLCKIGEKDIFNPSFDISTLNPEEMKQSLEILRLKADEIRHHLANIQQHSNLKSSKN